MTQYILCILIAAGLPFLVMGAECSGSPDPNAKPNMNAIITGDPVFVKSVTNGALYTVGEGADTVPMVHLWGTPYQKGFAHGQLMKDHMAGFLHSTWAYLEKQVEQAINGTVPSIFPPNVLEWIADVGLDVAFDLTSDLTGPYTGEWYNQEMEGMSASTGIDIKLIRRIHMIGELTKGSCSMFGAWGDSLQEKDGLLTMRALDWDIDGPFKDFPQITVYHAAPNSTENDFINIGWTGWIGSISGVNNQQMSIHEIGVSFPDSSFGNESRVGVPFTYVLRDILQFDKTRLDGLSRLAGSRRTCDLILGVGGGKERRFNSVAYSYSSCSIMDDKNLRPVASWHQPIDSVVYHGMDWLCPAYNKVLNKQLNSLHGKLTAPLAIQQVMAIVQTGDLHVWVADLVNNMLWVSHARGSQYTTGALKAYDRAYTQIDMNAAFNTQPKASQMV